MATTAYVVTYSESGDGMVVFVPGREDDPIHAESMAAADRQVREWLTRHEGSDDYDLEWRRLPDPLP